AAGPLRHSAGAYRSAEVPADPEHSGRIGERSPGPVAGAGRERRRPRLDVVACGGIPCADEIDLVSLRPRRAGVIPGVGVLVDPVSAVASCDNEGSGRLHGLEISTVVRDGSAYK